MRQREYPIDIVGIRGQAALGRTSGKGKPFILVGLEV
jgi:hypothetical protein